MRPARGVSSKNALQALRAVATLFRHCRARHLAIQVIVHLRSNYSSGRGHRHATSLCICTAELSAVTYAA
jgi:hypothetical protein